MLSRECTKKNKTKGKKSCQLYVLKKYDSVAVFRMENLHPHHHHASSSLTFVHPLLQKVVVQMLLLTQIKSRKVE
jgi:hypothetical protein